MSDSEMHEPTTKQKPKQSFRFGIRWLTLAVTLVAVLLGGWLSRDSKLGNWIRPHKLQQQVIVSARNSESAPLETGILVRSGDRLEFRPNKNDRWSAHGPNGPYADYTGSGTTSRLRLH